jgi:hypothetical protein
MLIVVPRSSQSRSPNQYTILLHEDIADINVYIRLKSIKLPSDAAGTAARSTWSSIHHFGISGLK